MCLIEARDFTGQTTFLVFPMKRATPSQNKSVLLLYVTAATVGASCERRAISDNKRLDCGSKFDAAGVVSFRDHMNPKNAMQQMAHKK